MPRARTIETGLGHIADPGNIETVDGKLTEQAAAALSSFVLDVVAAINGNLSLGDDTPGSRMGNLDARRVEFFFTLANTEYAIPHPLKRVPSGCPVLEQDAAASFYVSRRAAWTDTQFYMKSSAAGVTAAFGVY